MTELPADALKSLLGRVGRIPKPEGYVALRGEGSVWRCASVTQGAHPMAWLVNIGNRDVQSRTPASRLLDLWGPRTKALPGGDFGD